MRHLSHEEIEHAAREVGLAITARSLRYIYPIPRGGVPVAYMLHAKFPRLQIVSVPHEADCYVDDLIDSGATRDRYSDKPFFALFDKSKMSYPEWLVFPWEASEIGSADDIGLRLLQFIGEDVTREGLKDTPARFLKAWREWTRGYSVDLNSLFTDFGDGAERYDEMVLIDPIPFYSHCEHHLAAIFGTVHLAYIPDGRIAGLSKFCRLVDALACRLQVQERLTVQIADFIQQALSPLGIAVMVRARHFCMESRGAKKPGAMTTTTALRGVIKDNPAARAEFFSMVNR